jgi:uncharacterized repeat protein (TIGR03803 family)
MMTSIWKHQASILRLVECVTLAVVLGSAVFATQSAQAQTYKVLYSFKGGADGATPYAALVRDTAGNLYGTTFLGGASNLGTVFKLDTAGKETLLHSFKGGADGAIPYAALVRDAAGNIYGTAGGGGASNSGTVFKLDTTGTETVLYTFKGGADGRGPASPLVLDPSGNLYGMTNAGGKPGACFLGPIGCGVVFKLDTTGTETVVYTFTGGTDGGSPYLGGLVLDSSGNLYGTTAEGGVADNGVVFKLDTTGTETVLYSFGNGGVAPYAGLVRDAAGNLYGTTTNGSKGFGTVFKLDTTGNHTLLHSFTGGSDGAVPYAGLVRDAAGNLYGTTTAGGASNLGTVFELVLPAASAATLSPTSLNFGNQTVGINSVQMVSTLTNTGNRNLAITSIVLNGLNQGSFAQSSNCPGSLSPNASCNITVTFKPTDAGNRTAAVGIADNAPNSPQQVSLTGMGVLPAAMLSLTSLTFPTQAVFTTSKAKTLKLTNRGLGILTINKVTVAGPFSQTNNCGSSVNPGVSCAFSLNFNPITVGPLTGSFAITDNAPLGPQVVTLRGMGSYIQLTPTTENFGAQPVGTTSPAKTITLNNKGSVAVSIMSISISGLNGGDFSQTNTCGMSVAPGAHCFIKVETKPTAMGTRTGVVSVFHNRGGSPQKVSLEVTGT